MTAQSDRAIAQAFREFMGPDLNRRWRVIASGMILDRANEIDAQQPQQADDGALPAELCPLPDRWYTLCERAAYADKITISGELAEAIVKTIIRLTEPQPGARAPDALEELSESDKDIAIAQAVEFAQYVSDHAKGEMVKAAERFLSLPYSQEIADRLATKAGDDHG
jgi:hypothetical protein